MKHMLLKRPLDARSAVVPTSVRKLLLSEALILAHLAFILVYMVTVPTSVHMRAHMHLKRQLPELCPHALVV